METDRQRKTQTDGLGDGPAMQSVDNPSKYRTNRTNRSDSSCLQYSAVITQLAMADRKVLKSSMKVVKAMKTMKVVKTKSMKTMKVLKAMKAKVVKVLKAMKAKTVKELKVMKAKVVKKAKPGMTQSQMDTYLSLNPDLAERLKNAPRSKEPVFVSHVGHNGSIIGLVYKNDRGRLRFQLHLCGVLF